MNLKPELSTLSPKPLPHPPLLHGVFGGGGRGAGCSGRGEHQRRRTRAGRRDRRGSGEQHCASYPLPATLYASAFTF